MKSELVCAAPIARLSAPLERFGSTRQGRTSCATQREHWHTRADLCSLTGCWGYGRLTGWVAMRLARAIAALFLTVSICACVLAQVHQDHECADQLSVPVGAALWDPDQRQCVALWSPPEEPPSIAAAAVGGGTETCGSPVAPPELRGRPEYRQETITVSDAPGGYVADLSKDDFRIVQGGSDRPISFFGTVPNAPASIGILVDTSGSMQPKIPQARAAIEQFLGDLNHCDDLFLFAFSSRPYLLQAFTTDHNLMVQELQQLHAYGQTALFDTIMQGMLMVQRGLHERKMLVVITDGMDNSSSATLNDVVAQARRIGIRVYSIGIGDPNAAPMPSLAIGPFVVGGGDIERVDAQSLKTLSDATGSKNVIIAADADGSGLPKALHAIFGDLPPQYTIGFASTDAGQPVKIEVRNHERATVSTINEILPAGGTVSGAAAATPGGVATPSISTPANLSGAYSGELSGDAHGKSFSSKMNMTIVQTVNRLSATWVTTGGASGTLTGEASPSGTIDARVEQLNPCGGSYKGVAVVANDGRVLRGSYAGSDCEGPLDASFLVSKPANAAESHTLASSARERHKFSETALVPPAAPVPHAAPSTVVPPISAGSRPEAGERVSAPAAAAGSTPAVAATHAHRPQHLFLPHLRPRHTR